MVRDMPCPALCAEFQSASLLLCESQLSTVDQLGQIRARTLVSFRVRVSVRATVRVRYMGRLNALWPTRSSYITIAMSVAASDCRAVGSDNVTAKPLARVRVRVIFRYRPCPALCAEFQSASLLLCESQLSTVDQLGHITAGPLARVRIRVS